MRQSDLFSDPDEIDAVFAKILTPNDDSGRHGVLIPKEAYSLLPRIPNFKLGVPINYTVPISTIWPDENPKLPRRSNYKHYHRYPERRITALASNKLDQAPKHSLIVVGRKKGLRDAFEIHVLAPKDPRYRKALIDLGFVSDVAGSFVLHRDWNPEVAVADDPRLTELLKRFDVLSGKGYVGTSRGGDTAVGHTFEHHMGVKENNLRQADYEGVELKAIRRSDFDRESPERTNLFLKEPIWIDGLSASERVSAYGYIDEDSRKALYSCVSSKQNGHGLRLRVNHSERRVYLDFKGKPVGHYPSEVLQQRLEEKLPDMFVGLASTKGSLVDETFFFHTAIFCSAPSPDEFVRLIEQGDVVLEIRMHITPSGSCRNHGSAFRIKMNKWPELFGSVREVRTK